MPGIPDPDRIIAVSPFGRPDGRIVVAAARAGATGIVDVGTDEARARAELDLIVARCDEPFGVRLGPTAPTLDLPAAVTTVVVDRCRAARRRGLRGPACARRGHLARRRREGGRRRRRGRDRQGLRGRRGDRRRAGVRPAPAPRGGARRPHLAPGRDRPPHRRGRRRRWRPGRRARRRSWPSRASRRSPRPCRPRSGAWTAARPGRSPASACTPGPTCRRRIRRPTAAEVAARLGADDLQAQLLPVGQDGAVRRRPRRPVRHGRRRRQAVDDAIVDHLAAAAEHDPLAPGQGIAASPRHRASDRPGADDPSQRPPGLRRRGRRRRRAAVPRPRAHARSARCAPCSRRPPSVLGDRPWGVGILGFVPPELRDEQLAVVRELPPPVALIAGGRPVAGRTRSRPRASPPTSTCRRPACSTAS